ncbi:hypothetical protein [Parenemella sanctibonifatiensis]|uniref:Uncharacterized protein n=1 Tax=Parenemella sanctibonifatiensis TaxID=2016505 RepID=A0A255EF89_9ACTN|nr:hypothetical protein [Parenemella sanctibonifatiensis]OYN89900.1 hypothetical protein CGZ91_10395 [Parenemella sanctibonifatiensis]
MSVSAMPDEVAVAAAIRLCRGLLALTAHRGSIEGVAHLIVGPEVAHHVHDPDGLVGSGEGEELRVVLPALLAHQIHGSHRSPWQLALPQPGQLGGLRGPASLTQQALAAGAAVLGNDLALLPHPVGPALQWVVLPAQLPSPPEGPREAEQALQRLLLESGDALGERHGTAADRPQPSEAPHFPVTSAPAQRALDRAWRWWWLAEAGLAADPAYSSHGSAQRDQVLRRLRDAARAAVAAAASTPVVSAPDGP